MSYAHYEQDGISGVNTSDLSTTNLFAHLTSIAPIYPVYVRDENGNIMQDSNGDVYDYGNRNNAGLTRVVLPNTNPLQTEKLNTNNTDGNSFNGNLTTDLTFLNDFKFTLNLGVTSLERRLTTTTQPFYGYYAGQGGYVYKYNYRTNSINFQQLLNYSKTLGSHDISILLGHENYDYTYTWIGAGRTKMFSYFDNQELSGAVTLNYANSSKTEYNTEGYFTRAQYDFKDKYFLSGSYRRDASSRFHPDYRWGNFWSAGAAWIISNEVVNKPDWFNMLKYKISYGQQGNDDIGSNRYTDTYDIDESNGAISLVFNTKGNEDITWETNGNFNTGIEFELFGGQIAGGIDYFYRKTTNMLSWLTVPLSLGYSGYYENIGDMVNKGIEVELTLTPVRTRDIVWSVNLNATHYRNKITYMPEERKGTELDGYFGYTSGNQFYGEGLPMYTWRLRKYAGVNENGQSMWYRTDADGEGVTKTVTTTEYSTATYYECGTSLPDLYGGFGTNLSFKGLDIGVSFAYSLGGKVYDSSYATLMGPPTPGSTGKNFHKDLYNAWSETNPSSDIPRWQYNDSNVTAASDRWLIDGSWLTFQNVNLGYSLPTSIIKPLNISKLRIYLAGDNLFYWSKRQGLDPRFSFSGSTTSINYSPIRSISGGISLQF